MAVSVLKKLQGKYFVLFAVCDVEELKGPSHKFSINAAIYWLIQSIFNCNTKSHLLVKIELGTSYVLVWTSYVLV